MYHALNRFSVAPGQEDAFETIWRERNSLLDQVPGFVDFCLLKGVPAEDHVPYISHSRWQDQASFKAWTESEHFREAHKKRSPPGTLLGPPRFEGFQVVVDQ